MSAATVAAVVGAAATAYSASQSAKGGKVQSMANPLAPYQADWARQLNQLINSPSSITNMPYYKEGMEQGMTALQRGLAATGQTQSGQEQIALQKFGLNYFQQMYQQMYSNLSNSATQNAVQGAAAYQNAADQQAANYANAAGAIGGALKSIYTAYNSNTSNNNYSNEGYTYEPAQSYPVINTMDDSNITTTSY